MPKIVATVLAYWKQRSKA